MKKRSLVLIASLIFAACSDNKKQEKELLSNILKVHDKLMGKDEAIMKNKMALDSLLKLPAKDTAEKTNMKAIELKLTAAEEAMEIWMQKFDPDVINKKQHDEIISYYNEQKKSIMSVDSLMNTAVDESTKYLSSRTK
ncbi:hypothetical protein [Mucilaginibacter sp. BT774]|uniref:hypothetical protein n=1 Tax=Mucilaginibacter sp. BT774 TaxID=3062276 RepID=UPI0026765EFF|nr:hypothetical protein [Mucilaginibacter sp. BT774]MDO3625148.1 hypothetical protein [Mucilaginibacter sp. BT774]